MPKSALQFSRSLLLILLIALGGCQAQLSETGSVIKPEDVNKIVIGVTDFNEVRRLLGPPTLINSFRRKRWIYIQDRRFKNTQRTFARSANRIEITFDNKGIVQNLERNFGETLLDPEADPNAELKSKWGGWLWRGEYENASVNSGEKAAQGEETAEESDTPLVTEEAPTANQESAPPMKGAVDIQDVDLETLQNATPEGASENGAAETEPKEETPVKEKKSWWRFW